MSLNATAYLRIVVDHVHRLYDRSVGKVDTIKRTLSVYLTKTSTFLHVSLLPSAASLPGATTHLQTAILQSYHGEQSLLYSVLTGHLLPACQ